MKKIVLLAVFLPLVMAAGLRPLNVIAEDATATWCGYCPQAYAGLEIMKGSYPVPDFVAVRYYATSGDYGSEETDGRIAYYGITGYPTVVFNGTEKVVGGGDATADGSRYDPVVSSLLTQGSPFWLDVDLDVGATKVTVTTTVTLFDDYSGTAPKLWVALTEDEISNEVTNVVRRVVSPGDVTITNEGQEQVIGDTFDIDPAWNTDKMYAVVFLQINNTNEILQAGSSYPKPDYHYRLTAPSRITRLASAGTFTSTFFLTNVGAKSDQFTVTLDKSNLPSGWSAQLAEPVIQGTVTLDPSESAEYQLEIKPNGNTGQGDAVIKVSSASGGEEQELSFRVITNDVDVNLVDDDGGEEFENYFTAALDGIGKTYGVWDVGLSEFNLSNLAADKAPVIVWSCGWSFPSLTKDDRDLLKFYLDHGGKLFLTGQDIGWDLCDGDSENATADAKQFYNNYLHAKYVSDDANNTAISGVAGDPITDGMSFAIAGGDGADNQDYPSIIDPYDASANTIFEYSTGSGAAVRAEADRYKVVYLAFGYEAIDNAADRKDLLDKALTWLGPADPISSVVENNAPSVLMHLETELLIRKVLMVSYGMPESHGNLSVYDALGRRVSDVALTSSQGSVKLDLSGFPSGCYFARLRSGDASTCARFVLVH